MSVCYSYLPNYFSPGDILAGEERLSCTIETPLPGLGILDSSATSQNLKAGTKLELPVWLALSLNTLHNPIVTIDIPKIYKDNYREILEADACAVTLSKWNPFYYELGMYLRKFNNKECEKIVDSLLETFKTRFRLIMDWAQNPIVDPTLPSQLPRLERNLFLTARKAKLSLNDWLNQGAGGIEVSEAASYLRKRKRTEYELE